MRLTSDLIKHKFIAGDDGHGHPILAVETHGGLFCAFKMSGGVVQTIAAAPHKAVLAWLVEQKEPRVRWTTPLTKATT
jgi:hypothetical protein